MTYIEREELIKDINETVVFTVRKGVQLPTAEMRGANKVIDRIKSAPTADVVEVRHGQWVSVSGDVIFKCSHCEAEVSTSWDYENDDMFKYCPCCGAKMGGEEG